MSVERKVVVSKAFKKSFLKFCGKNNNLKSAVEKAILKLQSDIFDPSLRTHKLSGNLAAYLSCSCGYDCRIIFSIEKDLNNPEFDNIILLDIGTHDEVY